MFKLILFFLIFNNSFDCSEINTVRNEYNTLDSKNRLKAFLSKTENSNCKEFTPYIASAVMQQAEYVFSPLSKYNYFNKGKKMLEDYIKKNPSSIDARYVRVMVQSNTPGFLNYKSDIESDIAYIRKNIGKSDIPENMKTMFLNNIANLKN
jgi:hypothetical protein